jgi:tartrate dehydrogenase/decarboxylase / D-malate dehydrogenase
VNSFRLSILFNQYILKKKTPSRLVDAVTIRMVHKPQSLDVILCTNLHGDILSDLAAALSGSIGIAPSSNVDPERKNPGLFEPVHGM